MIRREDKQDSTDKPARNGRDSFPDDSVAHREAVARDEKPKYIGEIIESETLRFVAQCPQEQLHEPPEFGTFVKVLPPGAAREADSSSPPSSANFVDPFVERAPFALPEGTPDETLYALVCAASTGSTEPGRRPAAYGLDDHSLREEQPQIFALLATEFAAIPLAYVQSGRLLPHLPPRPPRLHAFVQACNREEVGALTEAPDFVRTLLKRTGDTNSDELLAACLRHAYRCRNEDFLFLVRAGKQLAILLRDDPERLAALLRKLEP